MLRLALLAGLALLAPDAQAEAPVAYRVTGDAVNQALTGRQGDVARGIAIVQSRETGNCVLCHRMPLPGQDRKSVV